MEVAILNYLPYILIGSGIAWVLSAKSLRNKIIALIVSGLLVFMYSQLQPSYAPKGVVKKAPHVVIQPSDGVMENRLSKPMSAQQRDEIRRKAYEEIDAKVEHLKP